MKSNKLVTILQNAHDSLTSKNWFKGRYFGYNSQGKPCMCAHGAIQNQINTKIQKISNFDRKEDIIEQECIKYKDKHPYLLTESATDKIERNFTIQKAWDERPKDIKKQTHYMLGLVGLTERYNDLPKTTLRQVKSKFRQAIKLAQQLT